MCLATQASTLGSLEIFSYCGCDRWSNGNAKHMIFFLVRSRQYQACPRGGKKEGTVRKKKNILTTPWTRNDRLVIHLFNAAVWIDEPSKTPLIYCTFWAAKELCKGKVIPFLSHKIYFMSCWHWWKDTKRCHTDDSNDVESWDAILEITETFTEIQLH